MRRPFTVESLETRRLLTAITLPGTGGNDTIRVQIVGSDYVFTVNGTPSTMPLSAVDSITIEAGAGNDAVDLDAADDPVTIRGGGGDDLIFLAYAGGQLDAITKNVTVDGGTDTDADELVLYDDFSPATFNDSYTFTFDTVRRTFWSTLSHVELEVLSLRAQQGDNFVSVQSLHYGTVLNVRGLGGDDTLQLASTTDNDLDAARVVVNFTAGAGHDSVIFNDAASTFHDSYTVDRDAMWRTEQITSVQLPRVNYSGVQDVTINASSGNNTINVERSPAGDGAADTSEGSLERGTGIASAVADGTIRINGFGGNDTMRLAPSGGNLNAITSLVDVDGGTGTDTLAMFDQNYPFNENYPITSTTANWTDVAGDGSVSYANLDGLSLDAAASTNHFVVRSVAAGAPLTINGGAGNETLHLAEGDLGTIAADVTFNGNIGTDAAVVDDRLFTLLTAYVISDGLTTWGSLPSLLHAQLEALTLYGGTSDELITVNTSAPFGLNVTLNAGAGNEEIHIDGSGLGTATTIDAGPGQERVTVNRDNAGFAAAVFNTAQEISSMFVGDGGRMLLSAGGNRTLRTGALTINPTGALNISDNAVVVDYTGGTSPLAAIRAQVTQGYSGGTWLGNGITSSTAATTAQHAIGYAEASALTTIPAIFGTVDATAVLLRYTRLGDADLNGLVNLNDFNRLSSAFGSGSLWSQGNFNYDSTINLLDFNILASNFGLATGTE